MSHLITPEVYRDNTIARDEDASQESPTTEGII